MLLYQKVKKHLFSFEKEEKILHLIAYYFQKIQDRFASFEFRPLQAEFAYFALKSALEQKPLALSLGCGEGKQEGFAVAIKVLQKLLEEKKRVKILFATATQELVRQMKNSPLFQDESVCILDENSVYNPKDEGIFFCDYRTLLYLSLQKKLGFSTILDDIDAIFADEFHYFLTSPDYIVISPNKDEDKMHKLTKIFDKIKAKKALLEFVRKNYQKDTNLIIHAPTRHSAQIDPTKTEKLYHEVDDNILQKLKLDFLDFTDELNIIASALTKEVAKDYYLLTKNNQIHSYCCSDPKSAKPSFGTVFQDKDLSLYIALKHIEPNLENKIESQYLADICFEKEDIKISSEEAVKLIGAHKFTAASATLDYVKDSLDSLYFPVNKLHQELKLCLNDKNVTILVNENLFSYLDKTKYHQILITAKSAKKLQSLYKKLPALLPDFQPYLIIYDEKNPDIDTFNKKIDKIKSDIQKDPKTKRVILAQAIAEGTNIFKRSSVDYKALVVKLDIDQIDTVTQTRYRVGTKGRVDGEFIHCVDFSFSLSDILTLQEKKLLQSSPIPSTLINIEKAIKPPKRAYKLTRRDFLKKAAAAAVLTGVAPNAIVDLVNKATNEQVLYKSAAEAVSEDWYNQFPPGIRIGAKRDIMIGNAYAEYKKYHDKERALAMLRINDKIFTERVKRETMYVSPAYWFMLGELRETGRAPINYNKLKKENYGLLLFGWGVESFFDYWERKTPGIYFEHAEMYFIRSLYKLAGFTKKDADKYLGTEDLNIKEKEIKKIYNRLASLKGAKPFSMDPNNAWNKQLTAAWNSFLLVTHYSSKKKYKKKADMIYKNLEVPLRKFVPKVRGPPYYFE